MSTVTCSHCGQQYAVAQVPPGKKLKCAKCGGLIAADTAESTKSGDAPSKPPAASTDSFFSDELGATLTGSMPSGVRLELPQTSTGQGLFASPGRLIAAGVVLFIVFAGLIVYTLYPSAPVQEPLARAASASAKKAPSTIETSSAEVSSANAPLPATSANAVAAASPSPSKPKPTATADSTTSSEPAPSADMIESARDAVVHLTAKNPDGQPFKTGSGFIIDRLKDAKWPWAKVRLVTPRPVEGDLWLVVTNRCVISGAWSVDVRLRSGAKLEALAVVHQDLARDLVILALDKAPDDLKVLPLADVDEAKEEREVAALGHIGLEPMTSRGTIQSVCETKDLPKDMAEWVVGSVDQQWIQASAAISSADSGGPLVTAEGKVVGINAWVVDGEKKTTYAIHSRYLRELLSQTTNGHTLWPFWIVGSHEAYYNFGNRVEWPESKINEELTRAMQEGLEDWPESRVNEELTRAMKRFLENGWKPGSRAGYATYQTAAHMLCLAGSLGYHQPARRTIIESLAVKTWDFDTEVAVVNRFAVQSWKERLGLALILGRVRLINKLNARRFWIELWGRDIVVAVTVPSTSEMPPLAVGDHVAVFGYRVGMTNETASMPIKADSVAAGLVTKVTLPEPPADSALLAAYDMLSRNRAAPGCQDRIRKFVNSFPTVVPMLGQTSVHWHRIVLNRHGRQFDAVRITIPKELPCDLIWSFNNPGEAIESWGVLPVKNYSLAWLAKSLNTRGVQPPGLSKEESASVIVQGLAHGQLITGDDFLMWFLFKDTEPRTVALATRLVPVDSFNPADGTSLGNTMRDGVAFSAEILSRSAKAMRDTPAAKPTSSAVEK